MTLHGYHDLAIYPIGPLQRKMLTIIKKEKEISIIEIGKRLGKYPDKMTNVHGGLQRLESRGHIEIKLPKGNKRNYRYAVFVKDYEEPKKRIPASYDLKERQWRQIIRGLQIIKKDKQLLDDFENDLLANYNLKFNALYSLVDHYTTIRNTIKKYKSSSLKQ